MQKPILILDFGSQYTQLIARRIREIGVLSLIEPYKISLKKIKEINPYGIIFSGGPNSVYDKNAPKVDINIFDLNIPLLGICYGMQLIAYLFKGRVEESKEREYGLAKIFIEEHPLFKGTPKEQKVWMSHGDRVEKIPKSFISIAKSENTPFAAFSHREKPILGLQFHPEVVHTEFGKKILENFLKICKAEENWSIISYKEEILKKIKEKVKDDKVVGGLSGGVDSTVAGTLLASAIGKNFYGIFVDTGLLRKNEVEKIVDYFKERVNLKYIDASEI